MDRDLDELLVLSNRVEEMAVPMHVSESAKLHLRNAAYLIRLAVEREEDKRRDAQ